MVWREAGWAGRCSGPGTHKTVPYSRRSPDSVFANIYFNANSYSSRSCLGLELQKFSKHLAAGFIFMAAGRAAAVFIGVMCAEFSCGTAGLAAAPRIASSHS